MAGHLIGAYHSGHQHCVWRSEKTRLTARIRPGTVTLIPESHDGHWDLAGPIEVSHVYLTDQRPQACADVITRGRRVELRGRSGSRNRGAAWPIGRSSA
jgi:AraC family transcriptional regulator